MLIEQRTNNQYSSTQRHTQKEGKIPGLLKVNPPWPIRHYQDSEKKKNTKKK